jgi:uncharacterized protein YggE
MENLTKEKSNLLKMGGLVGILLCVYLGTQIIAQIKGFNYIGGGATAASTMSFDGKGEVTAAPDLATVSFSIVETSKVVKDAQAKVTTKEAAVLAFLDKSGIAKKDIKTESYSSYPKYDYGTPCYYYNNGIPCRQESPTITGYEVSENISVKVRDLTQAGDIVKGIGAVGVSNMSGPNFTIEKEDALKAQARKMAIDDAKAKAESLAKDLGVKLVRIVNFSENGNYPIMYGKTMSMDAGVSAPAAPSPQLPTGENKITSNVTITYEIR